MAPLDELYKIRKRIIYVRYASTCFGILSLTIAILCAMAGFWLAALINLVLGSGLNYYSYVESGKFLIEINELISEWEAHIQKQDQANV